MNHSDLEGEVLKKAEDGDPSCQYQLGMHFLKKCETESETDAIKDGQDGIKWLLLASKQGDEASTEELANCLQTNHIGIANHLDELSWCVNTSNVEKKARCAAKDLFKTLNPLEGGILTKDVYMKAIDKIPLNTSEKKLLKNAAKSLKEETINEDAFVNKVLSRLHGSGGIVNTESEDSKLVIQEAYNNASWRVRVTHYPKQAASHLVDQMVEFTEKQGLSTLRALIPTNQIYMVFAFFMYSVISLELLLWGIPLFVFYISLLAMVISTMQMFYSKRKAKDVKLMADMLSRFNEGIDKDTVESLYEWNKLSPYISFFVSMVLMTGSFAMSDKSWIPCSELVFVSFFFTGTCFLALSNKYDYVSLLSFILDLVSTLPIFLEHLPRIPVVTSMINLVFGTVYSVEISSGLSVNFGVPSLAFLIVPLLFVKMAVQKTSGTYRILIPHLVCFFWWKVAVLFYRYSTWYGLIRGSVGWILLAALLPVFIIVLTMYCIFHLLSFFTVANFFKLITTIVLMSLPVVFGFWAKSGFRVSNFTLQNKSPVTRVILVFIFVLSAVPLIHYYSPPERDVEGNYMTWEKYLKYCGKPKWEETNIANSMILCSHFKYSMVEWQGFVNKVVVQEVYNPANQLMSYLPYVLSNWIKCTYGLAYSDCTSVTDVTEREICELATLQNKGKCHLQNMNKYVFIVWIKMPVSMDKGGSPEYQDLKLIASDWFKESVLKLKTNDLITFRASLLNNIGNIWPELKLYYLECETCDGNVTYGSKMYLTESSWNILNLLKTGLYETWNFFFLPIIQLHL